MEIFYSYDIVSGVCRLDADESAHAVKVLRHKEGDEIRVIDGRGTMYLCRLSEASPRNAVATVVEEFRSWGAHPYSLTMAVSPTKNSDRYEWFAEKAAELGVDVIAPVIGERSERRTLKTDRVRRVVLSAAKQSLKAALPVVEEAVSVRDFIESADASSLRLIACCFDEGERRRPLKQLLETYDGRDIVIMIGPEGDFSAGEARLAISRGFIPVSLGDSRLRTETAALAAVSAVYFRFTE